MIGLSMIGTFAAVILIAFAIPGLLAGYGLLRVAPWARVLTIVLAIFDLFGSRSAPVSACTACGCC
jgi:type IV secretory pathway VirB2 component (pilin)